MRVDIEAREIYFTAPIANLPRLGYVSAEGFSSALMALGAGDPISLIFETASGGVISEADNIVAVMQKHGGSFRGIVTGFIAGVAVSVLAECSERLADPRTQLKVESPWQCLVGNWRELKAAVEKLEQRESAMVERFSSRFGIDAETISSWLVEGKWLDADSAVELGIIERLTYEPQRHPNPSIEKISRTVNELNAMRFLETETTCFRELTQTDKIRKRIEQDALQQTK